MFNTRNLTAYYFVDQINETTISTISKFNNVSLIYLNQNESIYNIQDLINIKKFDFLKLTVRVICFYFKM